MGGYGSGRQSGKLKHTTGSEARSQVYSQAYNSGRMWRGEKQRDADGHVSKKLRTHFVRRFCTASIVTFQIEDFESLSRLEKEVQRIAPDPMFSWGANRGFLSVDEPVELTDSILSEGWSENEKLALIRQHLKYLSQ